MTISVLTLIRDRRTHLLNLMESLRLQGKKPDELIIACMQDRPEPDLPDIGIPVRQIIVSGEPLPLAKARNRAASRACGDIYVFLDVDCIASPSLIETFAQAGRGADGLYLGEVLYLPGGRGRCPIDFDELDDQGIVHPSKPPVPSKGIRHEPDCGEFWGLSFAIRSDLWHRLGGMDETFVGYGGEETDLAARLDAAGIPLYWTADARAYHQHHAVHVPPLPHFDAILCNARRFYAKHGRWCMDYWLGQFAKMGLIEWTADARDLVRIRTPTDAEIKASRQFDSVRFS